ncbi:MAG: AraC family transcriptional regulator [Capsulimonadaceae bacterium]|nr:AraC family transcriptional regulator [Capsulimonadaceae bacterium]
MPYLQADFVANLEATPIGHLRVAGWICGGDGVVPAYPLRVYGSFAIVFIIDGAGVYRDVNIRRQPVSAGDAIVVFPELPHTYGPSPGTLWSEVYFVFDGPAIEAIRQAGLIDPARPVIRPGPGTDWIERLQEAFNGLYPPGRAGRLRQFSRFLDVLTEMLLSLDAPKTGPPNWLTLATSLLGGALAEQIEPGEVAGKVGMSYETFRRRFEQATGTPPMRYRLERRIDAAAGLLRYTFMTASQIAEATGFCDAYYFSKRFKLATGHSPMEYRRAVKK